MDFKSYLETNAKQINLELDRILAQFLNDVKKINPKLSPLGEAFINSCQGGKRIRGVLVKLGYEIAAENTSKVGFDSFEVEIIKIAAALEILHSAILIHDDIIDQSPTRRGQPTLYQVLGGDHYGISQAMILGDIGLYLQTKILTETNFPQEIKIQALNHLSRIIIQTGWGQALDVELPRHKDLTEGEVKLIQILKTASYSVSGPLILGAILSGAEKNLIKVLRGFGENLGIAFQIQDDILGVFGSAKKMGKSIKSDIEEGKITLLITASLKRANSNQKQILKTYYGKGILGLKGLQAIRKVFKDTGALDYSRTKALEYVSLGRKMIPKITADIKMKKLLEDLTEYLVERSK